MTSPQEPALTIALALATGMLAQAVARHLRVPGIVMLLATGVLLGPDVANLIQPASLGVTLHALVGFAVAIILFEGGLNLNIRRLRAEASPIRRLVTIGAVITTVGGALAARWILHWDWTSAALFGTLVIVTGPTVVTPLLRRIRVKRNVATVLEAEGVFGDAIGAIIAVVALEVVLSPGGSPQLAIWHLASRLGLGALFGLIGGVAIGFLLRVGRLVPEGLENVFTLSLILVLFESANHFLSESGIVAVTSAGLVVGNARTRAIQELRAFKEQLTILMIAMLFVLLAADVRLAEVLALGWPGLLTVVALILIVRPLNVFASTAGSDLVAKERAFMAWMAPRGIVAAAVASLFAQRLTAAGIAGGSDLRAMVFLVIAVTVSVSGLTGGPLASLLGLRRAEHSGFVILGANGLARALGRTMTDAGREVVFLDSNPHTCRQAEEAGFRVLYGSAFAESVLLRAEVGSRVGFISATPNEEVNFALARRAHREFKVPQVWVALRKRGVQVSAEMVTRMGGYVLFGGPCRIDLWSQRLERGSASVEWWQRQPDTEASTRLTQLLSDRPQRSMIPLAVRRRSKVMPADDSTLLEAGDELALAVFHERRDEVPQWLGKGWVRLEDESEESDAASAPEAISPAS